MHTETFEQSEIDVSYAGDLAPYFKGNYYPAMTTQMLGCADMIHE
jgi:hypothetical protein